MLRTISLEDLISGSGLTSLMISRQDTGSILEIMSAVNKLGLKNQIENFDEKTPDPVTNSHGRVFAYLDSHVAFFVSIFTCLLRAVANLIMALLSSFTMLCSDHGYNFCVTHFYRTAIDLNCARIAVIGTFLPLEGAESFKVMSASLNEFVS